MACPYLQPNHNDMHNDNGNDMNVTNESPIVTTTTTANGVDNQNETNAEPLNYTKYVGLTVLLSSLQCLSHTNRSDDRSPPVHDEHFFILIHQVFELWFKQIIFEIDSIRYIFSDNDEITSSIFNINLRLNRMGKIWNLLIEQLQLLESMTPIEFLEFRDFITPASGFQSSQFRTIEVKLGLTDKSRKEYQSKYFTETMFKGNQSSELKRAIGEVSLLCLVERWLEKVYDSTSFNFLEVYTKAVESKIEHEMNEKIQNGIDKQTAEDQAVTARRQFEDMIAPDKYQKLCDSNERRISHKAMLAALMIAHYHQQPCFQQLYQMLNLLMDIDALMASWRHKHVLLVLRQIGRKPGTGGTGGFSYLQKTLTNNYQVFIDLFNISSYLIPQRFLPKFVDNSSPSVEAISSLALQPPREVPIIVKRQPSRSKRQFNQDQIFLYLFLFVAGCGFSVLLGQFT